MDIIVSLCLQGRDGGRFWGKELGILEEVIVCVSVSDERAGYGMEIATGVETRLERLCRSR